MSLLTDFTAYFVVGWFCAGVWLVVDSMRSSGPRRIASARCRLAVSRSDSRRGGVSRPSRRSGEVPPRSKAAGPGRASRSSRSRRRCREVPSDRRIRRFRPSQFTVWWTHHDPLLHHSLCRRFPGVGRIESLAIGISHPFPLEGKEGAFELARQLAGHLESFAGARGRRVSSRPVARASNHLVLSRGWCERPRGPA